MFRTTLWQFPGFFLYGRALTVPMEGHMGTAGLNALAMILLDAFRPMHGGGGGGFGFLLIGLVVIGVVIWAVARSERKQAAKN